MNKKHYDLILSGVPSWNAWRRENPAIKVVVDLREADLSEADLYKADLSGANLRDGVKIQAIYVCGPQGSRGDYLQSFLCDDGKFYFSTGCVIA